MKLNYKEKNEIKIINMPFHLFIGIHMKLKPILLLTTLNGDTVEILISKIDNNTWYLDGKLNII